MHFVGCSGNSVNNVQLFTVENTTFEGSSRTALLLNKVTMASISRSKFLLNGLQDYSSGYHQQDEDKMVVGGALNILSSSNVSVISSKFSNNTAERAGAMFIQNSSVHIIPSNFSYNGANISGGVIESLNSSINIK